MKLAMLTVLRTLGNLVLAVILVLAIALVLSASGAIVLSQTWEDQGLDHGVEDGAWAWIDGQPIYYQTWGSDRDPCAVLLHGFYLEASQTWEANARALARSGMRVIAVDLKGFGHSARDPSPTYSTHEQATLLAKVLNQLGAHGATIVAHGWGGRVALQLAHEQPQFVGKLALIAPTIHREITLPWQPVVKVPYLGPAVAWATASGGPLRTLIMRHGFHDTSALSGAYLQSARQPTRIVGTLDALLAMAASPSDDDLPQALSGAEFPVLIVLGGKDPWVSLQDGLQLEAQLPQGKLTLIPEVGHYPHIERSAEVNRHVAEFCLGAGR